MLLVTRLIGILMILFGSFCAAQAARLIISDHRERRRFEKEAIQVFGNWRLPPYLEPYRPLIKVNGGASLEAAVRQGGNAERVSVLAQVRMLDALRFDGLLLSNAEAARKMIEDIIRHTSGQNTIN